MKRFWYRHLFQEHQAATADLSLIEQGALLMLRDHYYQRDGKVKAIAIDLLRACRCQTDEERAAVHSVLEKFFYVDESGMLRNTQADDELGIAANVSAARSSAGKAGAKKRWNESKPIANAMANEMPNAIANEQQDAWQNDAQLKTELNKNILSGNPDLASPTSTTTEASKRKPEPAGVAEVLNYLNARSGHRYGMAKGNTKHIAARLASGYTFADFKAVIDSKIVEWGNDLKMKKYLRPMTLFAEENFANYLGQAGGSGTAPDNTVGGEKWE